MNLEIEIPNLFDLNKKAEKERADKQMLEKKFMDMDDMFQDMDVCDSQPMTPNNMDSSQVFDFDLNFNNNESTNYQEQQQMENQNKNENLMTKKIIQKQFDLPSQLPEIEESSILKSQEIESKTLENNNNKKSYVNNDNQQNLENNLKKLNKQNKQTQSPTETFIANNMYNNYSKSHILDKAFILTASDNNNVKYNKSNKSNSNESQSTRNGESLKDTNVLKQLNDSDKNTDFFNDIFFSQSFSYDEDEEDNNNNDSNCNNKIKNIEQFNKQNENKQQIKMSHSQSLPEKKNQNCQQQLTYTKYNNLI